MTTDTPQTSTPGLPAPARRMIALTAIMGTVALVVAALHLPSGASLDPWTLMVLGLVSAGSIVAPLRFHHDGGVQGFNLAIGVVLAALVLLPDAAAVLLGAGSALTGYAISTRSTVKTVFNVGQEVLWASGAVLAARLVAGGEVTGAVLQPRPLAAVAMGSIVAVVVNISMLIELFHRLRGERRRQLFVDVVSVATFVTLVGNLLVGMLLSVLAANSPVAVLLALPLLAGLQLGYRGYAAEQEAARRASMLQKASSQLLESAIDDAALSSAIGGLRELFGADVAVLDAGERDAPGPLRPVLDHVRATGMPVLETGGDGVVAVPVVLDARVVGALAVAGRHGLDDWDHGDVAMLSTVAGEVAASLRARHLFDELEQERAALEAEGHRLNDILRTASDAIVLLDANGSVRTCNPAMAALVSQPVGEIVGRPWELVLRLQDDEGRELVPGTNAPLVHALSGGDAAEGVSVRLLGATGGDRWLRCSAAPVRRDGRLDGVVVVAADVTREHEVEELRNDFIATVSHELRTPLTPLRGFLAVLSEHGSRLEQERLDVIHSSMDKQLGRLEDLIGDLLVVAELERGLTRVHHEPVDMTSVVEEVIETEAPDPAVRSRIHLKIEGEGGDELIAMSDTTATRRILRSLLSNALKHTDGGVHVGLRAVDGGVEVRVDDEGDGIGEWARAAIFEPFRRLGNYLHRTQGPGLGLAIAKAMADALGGRLEVAASPYGGARFLLLLPAAGYAEANRSTTVVRLQR